MYSYSQPPEHMDLSVGDDDLDINALHADLEDDMMGELEEHGNFTSGFDLHRDPDILGAGGWAASGGVVEMDDHDEGVNEAHMLMIEDDAIDPELYDSGMASLPLSPEHRPVDQASPSNATSADFDHDAPQVQQIDPRQEAPVVEIVYASEAVQDDNGQEPLGKSISHNRPVSSSSHYSEQTHRAKVVPLKSRSIPPGPNLELDVSHVHDKIDGNADEFEEQYTPPGEATPPYTPPDQEVQGAVRGTEATAKFNKQDSSISKDLEGSSALPWQDAKNISDAEPGAGASDQPKRASPSYTLAGMNPEGTASISEYPATCVDDNETAVLEKAPNSNSPKGFLGEVFMLDRIAGKSDSIANQQVLSMHSQDKRAIQEKVSATAGDTAACNIDELMANLEFSTSGPPPTKQGRDVRVSSQGDLAAAKKKAPTSSVVQKISGTVAEMQQDAATNKKIQSSSGLAKAKQRVAGAASSSRSSRSGGGGRRSDSAPRERSGISRSAREQSGSAFSSPERQQRRDKSPLQQREKGWNGYTKASTNQARKGHDPASKAYLKVQGPTREEAMMRKKWALAKKHAKEEQERKESAKRQAAQEAALKEKEERAHEIRKRLEAKAAARQQKRDEERQMAKKAALSVSKGKPLYQRLEENAQRAAAREKAEKQQKYDMELGNVRRQKTTAIIREAKAKRAVISALTRDGASVHNSSEGLPIGTSEQMMYNPHARTFEGDGQHLQQELLPLPEHAGWGGGAWGGAAAMPYPPGEQMATFQSTGYPMGMHGLAQQNYHANGFYLPPIMESPYSTYRGNDGTLGSQDNIPVEKVEVATSMGDSFNDGLGLPPLGKRVTRPVLSDMLAFNMAIGGPPRVSKPAFHVFDDITLEELAKTMPDDEPVTDPEDAAPTTPVANPTSKAAVAEDFTRESHDEGNSLNGHTTQAQDSEVPKNPSPVTSRNAPVLSHEVDDHGHVSPALKSNEKAGNAVVIDDKGYDSKGGQSTSHLEAPRHKSSMDSMRRSSAGSDTVDGKFASEHQVLPAVPPAAVSDTGDGKRPPGRRRSSAGSLSSQRTNSAGSNRSGLSRLYALADRRHSGGYENNATQKASDTVNTADTSQLTGIAALKQISSRRRSSGSEGKCSEDLKSTQKMEVIPNSDTMGEDSIPGDSEPNSNGNNRIEQSHGHIEKTAADNAQVPDPYDSLPLPDDYEDANVAARDYEGPSVHQPLESSVSEKGSKLSPADSAAQVLVQDPSYMASSHDDDDSVVVNQSLVNDSTLSKAEKQEDTNTDDKELMDDGAQSSSSHVSTNSGPENSENPMESRRQALVSEGSDVLAMDGNFLDVPRPVEKDERQKTSITASDSISRDELHEEYLTEHEAHKNDDNATASSPIDSVDISFGSVPNADRQVSQSSQYDTPPTLAHETETVQGPGAPYSDTQYQQPSTTDTSAALVDDADEDNYSENYDDDDYEDDFDDDAPDSCNASLPHVSGMNEDNSAEDEELPKKSSLPIWLQ